LQTAAFQPSRAHRQLQRRIERYLQTGDVREGKGQQKDDPSQITMEMAPAACTEEVYQLYRKYQITVHKDTPDEVTKNGFTRFLVDSPLQPGPEASADKPQGTYHQLHRLDGRLVAVGVVDLLPSGLSSVYLFYDPDCRDLVLGKYTALKEIQWCQEHELQNYYMGFYIHDCPKMRYKAEYSPSELLCSVTMTWQPYDKVKPFLDANYSFTPFEDKYAKLRASMGILPVDTAMLERKARRKAVVDAAEAEGKAAEEEEAPADEPEVDSLVTNHALRALRPRFAACAEFSGAESLSFKYEGHDISLDCLVEPGRSSYTGVVNQFVECAGPANVIAIDIKIR
jgi:arginyl-tRNA--protein-N-Asp/Glu arginylyltransferase